MAGCLVLALSASNALAAFSYWDPQGRGAGGPVNGTWENLDWSPNSTGSTTPVAWGENNAAVFAVGGNGSTPFTVTMNASHTVAGIFNPHNGAGPCSVTISGTGTMIMPAGTQQGFFATSPAVITINVPISGSGAQLIPESSGELDLNGANTYTGGTAIGFAGNTMFNGTINFNNSAAFGTGPVSFAFCPILTLGVEGGSAVNIPNAFSNTQTTALTCTINGNPAGLTFSGPWNLTGVAGAPNLSLASGGSANNIVAFSGVISGTNGITFNGPGVIILSGANSYGATGVAGGSTTIASGSVVLANTSGSATGVSDISISSSSATLTGNGTATGMVDNLGNISATNLAGGTATLTTGAQTWEASSAYQWAINNATGTAGATSGWDQLTVNGGVTINATGANPLVINVISLTSANQPGALATFSNTRDYSWRIIHSTSPPMTGFSTTSVTVASTMFSNPLGSGVFTVSTNNTVSGGDLFLNFVHAPALTLGNVTVTQGGNAVFSAVNTIANSTAATAVYSWKSNNVPLSDGGRISGSTTPTLTIANAQPGDATTYTVTAVNAAGSNSVSATLTVSVASTIVTWPTPAPITYGAALTTNQLDATANLPGTFVYNPSLGTLLNSGTSTLSVVFTPTDTIHYQTVTDTVSQVVLTAPLTVTGANFTRPQGTTNPVFTGAIVGLQNGDNITATYSCSATTSSPRGTYPIVPALVDPNNRRTNYTVSLINGTLDIGTIVTWTNPSAILYGTALGSSQLNATANVPGHFVYNPNTGAELNTGTYLLSVVFTPNDTVNYQTVTGSVSQVVSPAPLTVTAANATRPAGTANPVFTGTITGLQNGDNITATYATSANSASPTGTYPIVPTLMDPSNRQTNYSISLVNGTLVVTAPPPPITVGAPNIIPLPVTLQMRAGTFTLCPSQPTLPAPAQASMQILADGASQQTGQYLAAALFKSTGYQFQVITSTATNAVKGAILITTSNAIPTLGAEGYELTVAPDSVLIRAPAQGGTFYGVQSFLQLLPPQIYSPRIVPNVPWVAPCVYIEDQPSFPWRGVMLDVARHFFNKDEVKVVLDAMAMHKLNTFHWHLVDDQGWRLEITNYPNLTGNAGSTTACWRNGSVGGNGGGMDYGLPPRASMATNGSGYYGGFYTQADAKEIVAYAAARHITVVPEIEMPCHSDAALGAYGQFACAGDSGIYTMDYYGIQSLYYEDLFSLGSPGFMPFIQDVLTEVMGIFPGQYIHCGGDEVISSDDQQWPGNSADQTNFQAIYGTSFANTSANILKYQYWLSTNVSAFLNAHGRTMIGWSEIESSSLGVVPNAAVMDWETSPNSYAVPVAEAGLPVVMSPDSTCYINYVEGTGSGSLPIEPPFVVGGTPSYLSLSSVYAFNPIPSGLPAQYTNNILGAQCNLWGEYVPSFRNVMFKMFPRETAMAEVTWTPLASQNFSSFTSRLAVEEQRFTSMGLNYDHESIPTIGTWSSVPTSGSTLNFNITPNVTAAGEIDISFWYLSGSPLAISSVALLVNGVQVDIDTHSGTASGYRPGSEPFIPIFTLYIVHLPELIPGATYTIQAVVAGSGGTATSGTIYMPNWN